MAKTFNVTGACIPELHYMVDLSKRLQEIKELVDAGKYFTMNRARQYGKTTTLRALNQYLQGEYLVVSMDFQTFGNAKFKDENVFSLSFANSFLRVLRRRNGELTAPLKEALASLQHTVDKKETDFELKELFEVLSDICGVSDKPFVLMIDEVDSATNNQVFLDFLAQLRAYYMDRFVQPSFRAVILAGVYDVKNLRRKLRPKEDHKVNSPWNIAADFNVDMSFSKSEIAGMLWEYEQDYQTGMDISKMAGLLFDYTSGYPFLVSRLCKLLDEEVGTWERFKRNPFAWTSDGFHEAVRILISEQNALFESLTGKLTGDSDLDGMIRELLFTGKSIAYNPDMDMMNLAVMFGFIKNQNGTAVIANRIFETRLYNYYLSTAEMQGNELYKASLGDRSQFVIDGHLNMRRILEKFTEHFHELYGDRDETFLEEEGRTYFLLYLRPIINGTGNYYIEARTRELRRTDVIVDYHGEQYIIEMKIWHGQEYHKRGEQQLLQYLNDYQKKTGYLVSFNFNQKKETGVREIVIGDKKIIEAVI